MIEGGLDVGSHRFDERTHGRSFHNELVIVFSFEPGRIRSFREFVGMPVKIYENP